MTVSTESHDAQVFTDARRRARDELASLRNFTHRVLEPAIIKYLLLHDDISQRELAKQLGLAKSTVNQAATAPIRMSEVAELPAGPATSALVRDALLSVSLPPGVPLETLCQWALIYDAEHGLATPEHFPPSTLQQALHHLTQTTHKLTATPHPNSDEHREHRLAAAHARTLGATDHDITAATTIR